MPRIAQLRQLLETPRNRLVLTKACGPRKKIIANVMRERFYRVRVCFGATL